MKTDKVILGENCIYSSDCDLTQLNNNIIVCGSSGAGKTMSVSEPRLLETMNSSLVITLSKRKLVKKYSKLFENRGYTVWDLNLIQPEKSTIAYDPLAYVGSYTDVRFLAESIVRANVRKKFSNADPYWDDASILLLEAEILYTLMMNSEATFADVMKFHESIVLFENGSGIRTSVDDRFAYIMHLKPDCRAGICWQSFHQLPMKTASCVLESLHTAMYNVFTEELRDMMALNNRVDFEKIATQKTILFISVSAVNPALHCFVNMFYGELFKQLFEYAEGRKDGVLPIPVHVLCDDFATGSTIQNFPEYISIFREKRISVTLLIQSESQLISMYGIDDATTIINNCDTMLYMGGTDLRTCENISKRLNVPLDEVLYMPLGNEVIFRRGNKPVITKRYNILNNSVYQEVTQEYERSLASER